jgi:hypothetical protein
VLGWVELSWVELWSERVMVGSSWVMQVAWVLPHDVETLKAT